MSKYDVEVEGTKAPFKWSIFYKVHEEIAEFKSRTYFTGWLRMVFTVARHKRKSSKSKSVH